jgi:hypothetical protein
LGPIWSSIIGASVIWTAQYGLLHKIKIKVSIVRTASQEA